MNPNEAIKFSVLAGEIMLSSGAETYRVEDTMIRILGSCGFKNVESFVTTTGVFASVEDEERGLVTMVKRVKTRTNNFERIACVNDLSRNFVEGKIEIKDAVKRLEEIKTLPPYSPMMKTVASAIACFCFAYIFGGQISDCFNALLTGFLMQTIVIQFNRNNVASVLINILGGTSIAFFALAFMNLGLGQNLDKVIIGSIMPLVPGVSITNAIRDILEGDFLSGTTRIMDAVLIAISIAAGVGTVLKLWFNLFGGISI